MRRIANIVLTALALLICAGVVGVPATLALCVALVGGVVLGLAIVYIRRGRL